MPHLSGIALLAAVLMTLSACGGSGGDSPANASETLTAGHTSTPSSITSSSTLSCSQRISFAQTTVELQSGDTFTNRYSKIGDQRISYTSSNPLVAQVDSSGLVTAISSGDTLISAAVPSSDNCTSVPATYSVNVVEPTSTEKTTLNSPPTDTVMSAWIGNSDSLISFSSTANGLTFYSSSDTDCDFSHVANCTHGQFVFLDSTTIRDSATTLTQPGFYLLKDSSDRSSVRLFANATFSPRAEHQVIAHDGKLLLIGGYLGMRNLEAPDLKNDVWVSSDGISWTEQRENGGFSARTGQKVVNFNNSLWLIGGNDRTVDYLIPGDDNGRKSDVWSSADGITWTQQLSKANFSPRTGHEVVSFNNKLWVIGGDDKNGLKNDIWSSSNGITWIRQTANANFSPRADHQVVVFNGKLWLIGGSDKNDVWSSADGISWAQEIVKAPFAARNGHKVASYANKLWVIGGYNDSGYSNEVWWSSDGVHWIQETKAGFTPSAHFQLVSFADKLLLVGGYTQHGFSNDVWSTINGSEWRKGFSATFQFSH